jgi:iron only hydrogenase large subunit-like protein
LLHISCNFVSGSGSGGYAENVLTYAAEHILNTRLDRIVFEAQKNPDLREVTVKSEAGDTVLRFAIANGFRNIQNLVQKMKRKRCDYDLVEIMACPSGCLNGGAQLRQGHEWCNACLVPDQCVPEQKSRMFHTLDSLYWMILRLDDRSFSRLITWTMLP